MQKNSRFFGLYNLDELVSMIFGLAIVLILGSILFNYFKHRLSGSISVPGISTSVTKNEQDPAMQKLEILQPANKPEEATFYTVQRGDSLWKISKKAYGTGYDYPKLAALNNLAPNSRLDIGQKLILPTQPSLQAKPPLLSTNLELESTIIGQDYQIAKGDTLESIALRAYGDKFAWVRIWKANQKIIGDPSLIFSGNKIVIPR